MYVFLHRDSFERVEYQNAANNQIDCSKCHVLLLKKGYLAMEQYNFTG